MYTCIDLERLVVLYKNENQTALVNLANIEAPAAAIVVMSATDPGSYERFTDYELKILFSNICGMQHDGFHRSDLIKSVVRLVGMLRETKLSAREIEDQLIKIPAGAWENGDCYKYVYGSDVPAAQDELFKPDALVSVLGHTPKDRKFYVRPTDKVHKYVDKVGENPFLPMEVMPTQRERDPNAPREIAERPKAGSTTARVWEIADQCYQGHPHYDKQLRALVAAECVRVGINPSTMSVQFSKWRHSKNPG